MIDHLSRSQYFLPSISTVASDREAIGRQAMDRLIALIRGEPQPTLGLEHLFTLIPRASSGPAHAAQR